tara:strand:- start:7750 stop:8958 length:1209 start_codon:yes stop_codon:yes gene_type:complete
VNENIKYKNFVLPTFLKNLNKKNYNNSFSKILIDIEKNLDNKNTLNVLSKNFILNFNNKDLNRFKKFKKIAIIGMGGSILGSEAIYEFLEKKIKKKVFFLDNINEKKIHSLNNQNKSKILFIVISKSGNTIETISNLLYLKVLKRNSKNIIIISEKNNNYLFNLSMKYKLFFIEHKNYVGGRYSVFSEVGLVPALLMGLNINKLRKNLQKFFEGKSMKYLKNSTVTLTKILSKNRYTNIIFLNYSPELEKFLFWCQQLIAESLGKKNRGFLPIVSTAPKDHHSLLQLYLDGPKDKIFYLFSVEKDTKLNLIKTKYTNGINFIKNKSLITIKDAQIKAVMMSFKENKIPFREFRINKLDEETLGELFTYFMLETVILGKLSKVNPFNQPAVEQVKVFTKKLLS